MRSTLTEIFMAEWAQNFVFTHARAACHGSRYIQNPDQRHGPGFQGEGSRLFRIPQALSVFFGRLIPSIYWSPAGSRWLTASLHSVVRRN